MPVAEFGKKLNLPSNQSTFVKLKSKGEKIKFRIANTPHYETLHFINDGREVVLCGKFNSEDKDGLCTYCDQYVKAVDSDDKKLARALAPVTTFYYPVLNLETGKACIFQFTAKGIHYTIGGYSDEGVDVFGCDWTVERTEEKGNYYKVLRLGDKPLPKELKEEYERASKLKLKARESSSVVLDEEVPVEDQ